jgi:hypothetical protein
MVDDVDPAQLYDVDVDHLVAGGSFSQQMISGLESSAVNGPKLQDFPIPAMLAREGPADAAKIPPRLLRGDIASNPFAHSPCRSTNRAANLT